MEKRLQKYKYASLLCLLPGFGLIIGLFLIFFAVFEFKSRSFILIILGEMAISVLFFILLKNDAEYQFHYSKESAVLFSREVVDDLNSIEQKLKDFKLKFGNYPDSLEQLEKEYPELHIKDPLSARNPKINKSVDYNYHSFDTTYLLFSSGIDAIPNTKDDIYPSQSKADSILKVKK